MAMRAIDAVSRRLIVQVTFLYYSSGCRCVDFALELLTKADGRNPLFLTHTNK